MKEQLLQKLLELINKGQNFLEGQLPDIANQLLNYYMIREIFYALAYVLSLGIIGYLIRKIYKTKFEVFDDGDKLIGIAFISSVGIAVLIFLMDCISHIVQIHWAPKAYLLKSLMGGKCG